MRHGWRPLQKYLEVHDRVLRFHHKQMDIPKIYGREWVTPYHLELTCVGIILTTFNGHSVRVDLRMITEIDRSVPSLPKARTFHYSFNANRPRGTPLIRYCSPHDEDHLERASPHHSHHHKHDFTSGREKITLLDAEIRPHVGEFLNEVLSRF